MKVDLLKYLFIHCILIYLTSCEFKSVLLKKGDLATIPALNITSISKKSIELISPTPTSINGFTQQNIAEPTTTKNNAFLPLEKRDLYIYPATLPIATKGINFFADLNMNDASGLFISWSFISNVPAWLSIDSDSGLITGIPANQGVWQISVKAEVTESGIEVGQVIQNFILEIKDSASPSLIPLTLNSSSSKISVPSGGNAKMQFYCQNGVPPYTYLKKAGPSWINISVSTGAATGVAPHIYGSAQSDTLEVTCSDAQSKKVNKLVSVEVAPQSIWSSSEQQSVQNFRNSGVISSGKIRLEWKKNEAALLNDPILFLKKMNEAYSAFHVISGRTPYQGLPITIQSRCATNRSESTFNYEVKTPECPYGFIWEGYWATAGNPIKVQESGIRSTIAEFNEGYMSFGIMHEFGHDFDHPGEAISKYIFDSTTTEAWANLKSMWAMEIMGAKTKLNGVTYESSHDIIEKFFKPFFIEYQDKYLSFESIHGINSNTPGAAADYFFAIIQRIAIEANTQDSLRKVIKFYVENSKSLFYSGEDKTNLINQFIFIWSTIANMDLSGYFASLRYPVWVKTQQGVQSFLQMRLVPNSMEASTEIIKRAYSLYGVWSKNYWGMDFNYVCKAAWGGNFRAFLKTQNQQRYESGAAYKWTCLDGSIEKYIPGNSCEFMGHQNSVLLRNIHYDDAYSWTCLYPK